MIKSPILAPNRGKISVSRSFRLGTADYDVNEYYSPGNNVWNSKVLDLVSPKYQSNKTYWFDNSRYGNHGTITGATWTRLASGLPILSYDGDDYITIDSVLAQLASTTVGTWTIWGKMTDVTPASHNAFISFGDTNALEFMALRVSDDGKVAALCYLAGTAQWIVANNSASLTDNKPFQIGIVQNGTAPVLYVNGVANAQTFSITLNKTRWFSALTGLDNGRIGCTNYNNTGNANIITATGNTSLPKISTVAFSAAQMADDFNQERSLFGV
jgi:hypothetical protein